MLYLFFVIPSLLEAQWLEDWSTGPGSISGLNLKKRIRSLVPVVPILWPSEKFRSKAENHKLPIDENCIFAILPKSFLGPPELKKSPNDPILF